MLENYQDILYEPPKNQDKIISVAALRKRKQRNNQ